MPGILEWPGRIKKPFVTDIPAVTSDYFPTALAAANIPLPDDRDYDGINLLPLIDGKMKKRKGIGFHCRGMQAWVEHRYKVIRLTSKKREPNPWELYDLLADPFEEKDLAKELPERWSVEWRRNSRFGRLPFRRMNKRFWTNTIRLKLKRKNQKND